MVTIGVDAHKQELVAVAVDELGRELKAWRGANRPQQWATLMDWAEGFGQERVWGIEGAYSYGFGLAQLLAGRGEAVHEVNPRLTAAIRRKSRKQDKNDRLDARAVASAVLRESRLPVVLPENETALADILSRDRDNVLAEITRMHNQLHALLFKLDPGYKRDFTDLNRKAALDALEQYKIDGLPPGQMARALAVRRLAASLRLALSQLKELTRQIKSLGGKSFAFLVKKGTGIDKLTAAVLAGILGSKGRLSTDSQLAAYAGVAPLEASSGVHVRHRLNRGGNRRLNAVVTRIARTQVRLQDSAARKYVERRIAEGKTKLEALRALKRFVVRHIWRCWQHWQNGHCPRASQVCLDTN